MGRWSATKHDTAQKKSYGTYKIVSFEDIEVVIACCGFSSDLYTYRIAIQTKSILIDKEYSPPFLLSLIIGFMEPESGIYDE